jgi:hypothetical protein
MFVGQDTLLPRVNHLLRNEFEHVVTSVLNDLIYTGHHKAKI